MVEFRRATLWIALALAAAATLIATAMSGLSLNWSRSANQLLIIAVAPIGCLYRPRADVEWLRRMIDMLEGLCLFGIVGMLGAIGSYVVASHTSGYVDAWLAAADRSIGFDWLGWYELTRPWTTFHIASRMAYSSLFLTPSFILIAYAWLGRQARARAMVAATAIALALTITIFAWMPARSAVPFYQGLHPAYLPASDVTHVAITAALRNGQMTALDVANLGGLITFPSFHAAAAILFIWAAWPVRALRWPVLALNGMMLIATPLEGSHYLVDVFGGVAVAGVGIGAVHWPALAAVMRDALAPLSTPRFRLGEQPVA